MVWEKAGLLDRGEAEALALTRQSGADWFLTDDAAARVVANPSILEVHGSLGILLWAAAIGHLQPPQARAALQRLAGSSLCISDRILTEAMAALDKLE